MAGASPTHVVLGLLTDALDASYQSAVLRGAAEAAREHGAGLRCFAAGVLHSPLPASSQRNVLLDMVGSHNVDGLIVMTGSLANQVGTEALSVYLERYRPLPMCSVAVELPDMFSVLVDNEGGTWEAMQHLVAGCGRHRIAFVRGPATNPEAERRYRAYLDAVARLGLPIDPALVARGDFTRESGAEAARMLLCGDAPPDAIMAADDLMAIGVLDALREQGVAVPETVAVVGFNDIEESRFAPVPLTTVRQPLYEQGRRAALALLAIVQGAPSAGRLVLSTELVKRRSSGLSHETIRAPVVDHADDTGFEALISARREKTLAEIRYALVTPVRSVGDAWAPRVFDAFTHDLAGSTDGAFVQSVREMVSQALQLNTDGTRLQDVISILRRETLSLLRPAQQQRLRVEDLCEQARIAIAELVEHAQAHQRLQAQAWVRSLGQTIAALINTFDVGSLMQAVADQLPRLNIASCYLSLYTSGKRQAELRLALDVSRPDLRVEGRPRFDARDLVPAGVLDGAPRTFVVENLFFGNEQLGLVLFEFGPREGVIYEALRDQISAALKGALLVQEVLERNQERERLLQDLEERARQLERAYKALREGQQRMLLSESMASLGQMSVRCRPLAELYADILRQLSSLLGSEHAFIAMAPGSDPSSLSGSVSGPGSGSVSGSGSGPGSGSGSASGSASAAEPPSGLGALGSSPLSISARVGRFVGLEVCPGSIQQAVSEAFELRRVTRTDAGVALPLVTGNESVGVIYAERRALSAHDLDLLGTFANQATAAIHNTRLYRMAAQDPLTEVHARRFFDKWLPREVDAALRGGRPLGVLMVDMDDMKRINDGGGHLAGDRALVAMGRVLRRSTREHDVIARYGGDEFALVLPDSDPEGTMSAARRILGHARQEQLGKAGTLRCSVGAANLVGRLASSSPDTLDASLCKVLAERLVGAADEALYEAKSRGGACLGAAREVHWPD
ncbi:MAG: substrate-binding domain-containing protein [Myxococcota bacterium]